MLNLLTNLLLFDSLSIVVPVSGFLYKDVSIPYPLKWVGTLQFCLVLDVSSI